MDWDKRHYAEHKTDKARLMPPEERTRNAPSAPRAHGVGPQRLRLQEVSSELACESANPATAAALWGDTRTLLWVNSRGLRALTRRHRRRCAKARRRG